MASNKRSIKIKSINSIPMNYEDFKNKKNLNEVKKK
jgi:hypothetical protein